MVSLPRVYTTCAYAPLPLIHAAGFHPVRLLPGLDPPDDAGPGFLNRHVCACARGILDRALRARQDDVAGVVIPTSCDAMRRLADAWMAALPRVPVFRLAMPLADSEASAAWLADEYRRLGEALAEWGGVFPDDAELARSVALYDAAAERLEALQAASWAGTGLPGRAMRRLHRRGATVPIEDLLAELERVVPGTPAVAEEAPGGDRVPLLVTGNVIVGEAVYDAIDAAGGRVVASDHCAGPRQLVPLRPRGPGLTALARAVLARPPCARTLALDRPDAVPRRVLDIARRSGAAGIVATFLRHCDPYAGVLPALREAAERADLPLIVVPLELGARDEGRVAARVEVFVEMLAARRLAAR